ncbi:MAG: ribosome small subunit-dependent GTPase A [Selenomonadaceae bacterium]|nr:ribosome small subunit-dependent GTPase A [Selenomonadaceae bacterium]
MIGRVIKFYNSFFFVKFEGELIPCKLRGLLKRDKNSGSAVCPGDFVEISKLKDGSGVIERVQPRRSLLSRPAVANVDRIILTFAAAQPDLNRLLLNRFIALAEFSQLTEIIICINKIDLAGDKNFLAEYENLYRVVRTSAHDGTGVENLREIISGGVTVFAGPSGVGKSSLLNAIDSRLRLKTGEVSEKILRGKHTTRVAELIEFGGGFLVDTPGFSAVELKDLGIGADNLREQFKEFGEFAHECKFLNGCSHSHEPSCGVRAAADAGKILRERYESYLTLLNELK